MQTVRVARKQSYYGIIDLKKKKNIYNFFFSPFAFLTLDDFQSIDNFDLSRPGSPVDNSESLEFQANGDVRLGRARAVQVICLLEDRALLFLSRSSEGGSHEGANNHEFQHLLRRIALHPKRRMKEMLRRGSEWTPTRAIRTTTTIVSELIEAIEMLPFITESERGQRTFLKF